MMNCGGWQLIEILVKVPLALKIFIEPIKRKVCHFTEGSNSNSRLTSDGLSVDQEYAMHKQHGHLNINACIATKNTAGNLKREIISKEQMSTPIRAIKLHYFLKGYDSNLNKLLIDGFTFGFTISNASLDYSYIHILCGRAT